MNLEFTRAPHIGAPTSRPVSHNAALLIDFDNVTMGIRSNLGQELRQLLESDIIAGKVAVQRAYADWRRYPQYIVPLSESSIDLIFAPAYGSSKKNATDIRLAIDALELVFTRPEIGTFILLSGDSDFSSLVLKLKEYGKYVIGVGLQESTSDILVQNCDEYYSYNTLSGLTSASEMESQKLDPWVLVSQAVHRMEERNDVMRSDRLKQVMLEMDSTFDEKSAGFSKFNRFLAEAAGKELVQLRKGENGQYDVKPGGRKLEPGGEVIPTTTTPLPQERSRGGGGRGGRSRSESRSKSESRGKSRSGRRQSSRSEGRGDSQKTDADLPAQQLAEAYRMLADVVAELHEGSPVRDSMAKRKLLERDSDFDEGALGFRKFSRFLRQAHDEGIVDLVQQDDGNFYLTPADGGSSGPDRDASSSSTSGDSSGNGASSPGGDSGESRRRSRGRGRSRGRSRGSDDARESDEEQQKTDPGDRKDAQGETAKDETANEAEAPATSPESDPKPDPRQREKAETGSGASDATRDTSTRDAGSTPRRSLGRRRGSRGASSASPGTASSAWSRIGPVDEPASDNAEDDSSAGSSPAPTAADIPPPPVPTESESAVVEHMVRNYPGVGKRTAEALVDRFGDDVYTVIDDSPDRLTEAISPSRARAVVAARSAEVDGD